MDLNYKEFGKGDPLIILHGLFGTLDNWQTIAKQLAEHYWVFIVDQRNHGKSPHHEELSYPLMAEDLHNFMEAKWIPRAHIMGHSMGGKTAMQFALTYPDMVDKLIVVDIAPGENPRGHDLIFAGLQSLKLDLITSRGEADEQLEASIKEFGIRQFLLKNLTRNKSGGYRWKMNLPAIHENYTNILAAINHDIPYDGDSLFISGENSDYITETSKTIIHSLFPEAEIKTIADAGHWVHADQPAALLETVRAFLD